MKILGLQPSYTSFEAPLKDMNEHACIQKPHTFNVKVELLPLMHVRHDRHALCSRLGAKVNYPCKSFVYCLHVDVRVHFPWITMPVPTPQCNTIHACAHIPQTLRVPPGL